MIKLSEGLTTHLQGLVSAGSRFTASKLGYQETRYGLVNIPKRETHKYSHKKKYISLSRLAGGRYGNDGRKTRDGLWVKM